MLRRTVVGRLIEGLGAVGLVVLLVTGCGEQGTEPGPDVPGVYRTEIDQVLAENPSDLEREALADYHVSDEELSQAEDAFRVCMEAAGYEVSFEADQTEVAMSAELQARFSDEDAAYEASQADMERCEDGTTEYIGMFYSIMRDNPSGTTAIQELRACFEKEGIDDGAGMSDEELWTLTRSETYAPGPAAVGCLTDVLGEWPPRGGGEEITVGQTD